MAMLVSFVPYVMFFNFLCASLFIHYLENTVSFFSQLLGNKANKLYCSFACKNICLVLLDFCFSQNVLAYFLFVFHYFSTKY